MSGRGDQAQGAEWGRERPHVPEHDPACGRDRAYEREHRRADERNHRRAEERDHRRAEERDHQREYAREHQREYARERERDDRCSSGRGGPAAERAGARPPAIDATGVVSPARAADPQHEPVPDGAWVLPVPEQARTHRVTRGPGEPVPPGERAVVVEGSRFRLRELQPADVDAVLAVFGDPATTRAFGMGPLRRRDAVALVEHALVSARQRPRTHYRLGVSRASTGELIGTAKLVLDQPTGDLLVSTGYRSGEVGMALRADQASLGHSGEVGHLLGVLGFDRLGLHRIWAAILPTNVTAQRAAERAGMVREGLLRHYGYADGTWHDIIQYAILEQDWHARRGG